MREAYKVRNPRLGSNLEQRLPCLPRLGRLDLRHPGLMLPAMELCPYDPSSRYERAVRLEDRFLGRGGESDCVERYGMCLTLSAACTGSCSLSISYLFQRCRRIEDGAVVAIKKIAKVDQDDICLDEYAALSLANQHDVPNVVQVVELLDGDQTNSYLVLE